MSSELKVRQNPRTRTSSQFRSSLTKGTSSRSRSLSHSFLAVIVTFLEKKKLGY